MHSIDRARLPLIAMFVAPACAVAAGLQPTRAWDRERAAHLLRRAGFGGTPAEIDRLTAMGLESAVGYLVDYESIPQTDPDFRPVRGPDRKALRQRLDEADEEQRKQIREDLRRLDVLQIEEMRAWWIRRMIRSPRPFEERMTLFWHGHFTSGHREVRDSTMMYDQNAFLRNQALGRFADLLVGISQDPAMLRYLDNASNRKQAPNENYARELLELFTMGEGHYTEQDIKEAARALTGWTLRDGEFADVPRMHDAGAKTFLGRTGEFDGRDVIEIILDQPQAARFLARKILEYFVEDDPPSHVVEALATDIEELRYDMREVMRTLFRSKAFYAPSAMHSLIKSPVDLVVGTARLLELEEIDAIALAAATDGMGQQLFQPPNVKGWDGGRKWINTATLFARYNFASGLLAGTESGRTARLMGAGGMRQRVRRLDDHRDELRQRLKDFPELYLPEAQVAHETQSPFDPVEIIAEYRLFTADKLVNHFIDRFVQMRVAPRQREWLRALVAEGGEFDHRTPRGRVQAVSLINALLTMPEYQLK